MVGPSARVFVTLARFFAGEGRVRMLYLPREGSRDSYSGTGFPGGQDDSLERACPEPVEGLSHYQTTQTRGNDQPGDLLEGDDFFYVFQTRTLGSKIVDRRADRDEPYSERCN